MVPVTIIYPGPPSQQRDKQLAAIASGWDGKEADTSFTADTNDRSIQFRFPKDCYSFITAVYALDWSGIEILIPVTWMTRSQLESYVKGQEKFLAEEEKFLTDEQMKLEELKCIMRGETPLPRTPSP